MSEEAKGESLLRAIQKGQTCEAAELIRDPSTLINAEDLKRNTPLHLCCHGNHPTLAALLLSRGDLALNKANYASETPFDVACAFGYARIMRLLALDPRLHLPPLHRTVLLGEEGPLCELLRHGKEAPGDLCLDLNQRDAGGRTPLFLACLANLPAMVKLLLQEPSLDVNLDNKERQTPLIIGCLRGHLDVAKLLLLDPRTDLNRGNRFHQTAFCLACQGGQLDVAVFLAADGRVDLNAPDDCGSTPLFNACSKGHLDVVRFLSADPRILVNKANKLDQTPFFVACLNHHVEVVQYLACDPRVDLNKPSSDGVTPLWIACNAGDRRIVESLFAGSSRIDTKRVPSWSKKTPAQEASLFLHFDIVKLIQDHETNPEETRIRLCREFGFDGFISSFLLSFQATKEDN